MFGTRVSRVWNCGNTVTCTLSICTSTTSSADEYLDEHVADECRLDVGWREADLSRLANRERQVWDERREVLEVFREAHEVLAVVQRANARVQLLYDGQSVAVCRLRICTERVQNFYIINLLMNPSFIDTVNLNLCMVDRIISVQSGNYLVSLNLVNRWCTD